MKKLAFIATSFIFSLTLANASDLLFKATNGTLSENSLGVKKLSDEEMRQVKGGLELSYFVLDGHYGNEFGLVDKRTGKILQYSVSYIVSLENYESLNQKIEGYGPGTGRTNYWLYKAFADNNLDEYPVIYTSYNGSTGLISVAFGALNLRTKIFKRIDTPLSNAILARHGKEAANYMFARDMRRYNP